MTRHRAGARGITQLEVVLVLLLASPLVALGSQGLEKRILRARAQEAIDNVGSIYRGAVAYYEAEGTTRTGARRPKSFPASVGLTPSLATLVRAKGRLMGPRAEYWEAAWQALSFAMGEPHRYGYELVSLHRSDAHKPWPPGAPNAFTARAIGDLDGDGIFSTFERTGMPDETNSVVGGSLHVKGELE